MAMLGQTMFAMQQVGYYELCALMAGGQCPTINKTHSHNRFAMRFHLF